MIVPFLFLELEDVDLISSLRNLIEDISFNNIDEIEVNHVI